MTAPFNAPPGPLSRRSLISLAAAGGASLTVLALNREPAARAAYAEASAPLVGSWFALLNPPSGPVGGLITFNADGTLTQTSTEGAHQSPGHGAWLQQDDGQYLFLIRWFDFGPDGIAVGSGMSRGLVRVSESGDSYSGQAHVDHLSLDGTVLESHDTPARATRLAAQPLP